MVFDRVAGRWGRREGRAMPFVTVELSADADIGVGPGSFFVALEGEAEGVGREILPFVCTTGREGFFIFPGGSEGFAAVTAAIVARQHQRPSFPEDSM